MDEAKVRAPSILFAATTHDELCACSPSSAWPCQHVVGMYILHKRAVAVHAGMPEALLSRIGPLLLGTREIKILGKWVEKIRDKCGQGMGGGECEGMGGGSGREGPDRKGW